MRWTESLTRNRHPKDAVIICTVIFVIIVVGFASFDTSADHINSRYAALIGVPLAIIAGGYTLGAFIKALRIWRKMHRR